MAKVYKYPNIKNFLDTYFVEINLKEPYKMKRDFGSIYFSWISDLFFNIFNSTFVEAFGTIDTDKYTLKMCCESIHYSVLNDLVFLIRRNGYKFVVEEKEDYPYMILNLINFKDYLRPNISDENENAVESFKFLIPVGCVDLYKIHPLVKTDLNLYQFCINKFNIQDLFETASSIHHQCFGRSKPMEKHLGVELLVKIAEPDYDEIYIDVPIYKYINDLAEVSNRFPDVDEFIFNLFAFVGDVIGEEYNFQKGVSDSQKERRKYIFMKYFNKVMDELEHKDTFVIDNTYVKKYKYDYPDFFNKIDKKINSALTRIDELYNKPLNEIFEGMDQCWVDNNNVEAFWYYMNFINKKPIFSRTSETSFMNYSNNERVNILDEKYEIIIDVNDLNRNRFMFKNHNFGDGYRIYKSRLEYVDQFIEFFRNQVISYSYPYDPPFEITLRGVGSSFNFSVEIHETPYDSSITAILTDWKDFSGKKWYGKHINKTYQNNREKYYLYK